MERNRPPAIVMQGALQPPPQLSLAAWNVPVDSIIIVLKFRPPPDCKSSVLPPPMVRVAPGVPDPASAVPDVICAVPPFVMLVFRLPPLGTPPIQGPVNQVGSSRVPSRVLSLCTWREAADTEAKQEHRRQKSRDNANPLPKRVPPLVPGPDIPRNSHDTLPYATKRSRASDGPARLSCYSAD